MMKQMKIRDQKNKKVKDGKQSACWFEKSKVQIFSCPFSFQLFSSIKGSTTWDAHQQNLTLESLFQYVTETH